MIFNLAEFKCYSPRILSGKSETDPVILIWWQLLIRKNLLCLRLKWVENIKHKTIISQELFRTRALLSRCQCTPVWCYGQVLQWPMSRSSEGQGQSSVSYYIALVLGRNVCKYEQDLSTNKKGYGQYWSFCHPPMTTMKTQTTPKWRQ